MNFDSHSREKWFELMRLGPVWLSRESPAAPEEDDVSVINSGPLTLQILEQKVASCTQCGLAATRTQTVFSDGVADAPLMVIGEAPGADEDAQGKPFVGRAGQLLERMLTAIDLSRKTNVYIANVIKCRPPGNRNPEPDEVQACLGFLNQQIQLSSPKVLLLAGKVAISSLLDSDLPFGQLRGEVHQVEVGDRVIPAVATYHPAYLLRAPEQKAKAWEDLLLLKSVMSSLQDQKLTDQCSTENNLGIDG